MVAVNVAAVGTAPLEDGRFSVMSLFVFGADRVTEPVPSGLPSTLSLVMLVPYAVNVPDEVKVWMV
jgi:hypothetical protein